MIGLRISVLREKKKKSHCNKSTIEDRKIKKERREIKIANWINTYLIRVY